ncbi:MAG: ferritin family protein [bacterium]
MPADERALAGLREAILTEHTGRDFYAVASERTADPKGKEVFLVLSSEEARHEEQLKSQYAAIAAGRDPMPSVRAGSAAALDGDSPIFSAELRNRIAGAHWEMTALSVGLQLELNTIARYRELAATAGLPELQTFYEELVRWEEGHARALERQLKLLREDYWQEAGFTPF